MKEYKRLWVILAIIMIGAFTVLGYFGKEVYNERPPIPTAFVSEDGKTVYTEEDIYAGQTAWQSIGGMSIGSIWGHGAYQAPDWTADWLHREVLNWLDQQAQRQFGKNFEQLSERDKATLSYDSKVAFRTNTFDKATNKVTLSACVSTSAALIFGASASGICLSSCCAQAQNGKANKAIAAMIWERLAEDMPHFSLSKAFMMRSNSSSLAKGMLIFPFPLAEQVI